MISIMKKGKKLVCEYKNSCNLHLLNQHPQIRNRLTVGNFNILRLHQLPLLSICRVQNSPYNCNITLHHSQKLATSSLCPCGKRKQLWLKSIRRSFACEDFCYEYLKSPRYFDTNSNSVDPSTLILNLFHKQMGF
jgi:hypothetical protein